MSTNASGKWTVTNVYGIRGETTHRTPEAAITAASKREGEGWIVVDAAGNQWGRNERGEAVIVREASNA
ncbi:MAG: hypothetical protein ACK55P_09255 [Planctomyces sp.]